jgi:hypothetical protein
MAPLPTGQRRGATLVSIAGHGAFVALLTVVGTHTGRPSFESPLIVGELVTVRVEPAAAPAEPDLPVAEPTPEPAPQPPATEQPAPQPPATEQTAPAPEPEPAPPRERTVEPPSEPKPVERFVELPEPAPAETLAEALGSEPPQVAEGLPAEASAAEAAEVPSRALASHEERAVRRRLSSWTGSFDPLDPDATLEWREAGQDYTAVLKHVPAADAMGMEQLLVEVTTERDGERLVTELRMNRLAFSSFAQFIDRWDPQVQIHDDFIDGRFHSNSEILVSRERGVYPVFNGKVTVASGDIRSDGLGRLNRRSVFPAGLETRVRRIVLPPRSTAFDVSSVPADRVLRIAHDSLLTFHADGTFERRALDGRAAAEIGTLGEEPYYLVADDGVALHVRGTVNGKVLVYSPEQIVIVDDLRYAADPRAPGADDYLGLVAERTIEVDGPEATGPGDLEVQASIYARTRFAVRDYRSRRSGTLIIHGSVTAGSVSATEPRFATRIEFDDRLTTMRAPGFPLSNRYELDTVNDEWRVVDAQ